jgi:hypothetical protein
MGVPTSKGTPIKCFFRKELLAFKEICPADHFFHVSDEHFKLPNSPLVQSSHNLSQKALQYLQVLFLHV